MYYHRHTPAVRTLILLLLVAFPISVLTLQPSWLSQLTYAVDVGHAQVAEQQLAVATDLSQAFRQVAKAMRPSVVSISSAKRIKFNHASGKDFDRNIPEQLRPFFDDQFFGRYFSIPIPQGGIEQEGLGSGVIVSDDGYILTNFHVVRDADEIHANLFDGRRLPAKLVGGDKATDIAVLKIDAKNLKPAKLGKSANLEVGEWVLAIGSPFRLDQTVTAGLISAPGRANVGITDYEDFIQTDAAINPGNSGGPLVNLHGEVVGINTAIATRTGGYMGVGFAIPSEMAEHVMESIKDKGYVTRGYLGAMIQDLTEELARSFHFDGTDGVLIGDVVEKSPAEKAGLKSGDIVTKFNGQPVRKANELRNLVAATAPGTEVPLEIVRDGSHQKLSARVEQLDESKVASTFGSRQTDSELGIAVDTLTPQIASQLGIEGHAKGVVVTNVDSGSLAAQVGIDRGDIVVSVGNREVSDVAQFREAMKSQSLKDGIRLQLMREGAKRYVFVKIG